MSSAITLKPTFGAGLRPALSTVNTVIEVVNIRVRPTTRVAITRYSVVTRFAILKICGTQHMMMSTPANCCIACSGMPRNIARRALRLTLNDVQPPYSSFGLSQISLSSSRVFSEASRSTRSTSSASI